MKTQLLFFLIIILSVVAIGQEERSLIREGNELFKDSLYAAAETKFTEAININSSSTEAQYNLANTYYEQNNYEAAKNMYETLLNSNSNIPKDQLLHNIGNTDFKLKKYEDAVQSYKKSLIANPKRTDSRYNLAMTKKLMEQQEQNKDENKDDQDKDQDENKDDSKDGENKKDEDNKDSDQKDKDQKKDGDDDKSEGDSKDGEQEEDKKDDSSKPENEQKDGKEGGEKEQEELKKGELSKEQAEQLLRGLEDNEQELQKKMIKMQMKRKSTPQDKDW